MSELLQASSASTWGKWANLISSSHWAGWVSWGNWTYSLTSSNWSNWFCSTLLQVMAASGWVELVQLVQLIEAIAAILKVAHEQSE